MWYTTPDMHGHRVHPYAIQTASFYFAMAFPLVLLAIMSFGRHFDAFKRARRVARLASRFNPT